LLAVHEVGASDLRGLQQLERHDEARRAGARALSRALAQADRGERRLNRGSSCEDASSAPLGSRGGRGGAPRLAGQHPVRRVHVRCHLGNTLDQVHKRKYARVSGRLRWFIKGQKSTLLAYRENLTLDGRRALKALPAANK